MNMTDDVAIDNLNGLALDWLTGQVMGYKLKVLEAGARVNNCMLDRTMVFIDAKQDGKVTDLLNRGLHLYNPSQDWELLPDYENLFENVSYSPITIDNKKTFYHTWVCVYYLDNETWIWEGATKQEVILKGYIHIKGGYWHSVPTILLDDVKVA